jgi:hypothetical protein
VHLDPPALEHGQPHYQSVSKSTSRFVAILRLTIRIPTRC